MTAYALWAEFLKWGLLVHIITLVLCLTFIALGAYGLREVFRKEHDYPLPPDDGKLYRSAKTTDRETKIIERANSLMRVAGKEEPVWTDKEINMKHLWELMESKNGNKCKCKNSLFPGQMNLSAKGGDAFVRCVVGCTKCGRLHTLDVDRTKLFNKGYEK